MSVKSKIKKLVGKKMSYKLSGIKKAYRSRDMGLLKSIISFRVYDSYTDLFSKIRLQNNSENFFYSLDLLSSYFYNDTILGNLMIDYNTILDNSLNDFREKVEKMDHDSDLYKREIDLIKGLEILIDREISKTTNKKIIDSLHGIKNRKANSFNDAIQRILFYNQVLWQTNHHLNGLGRLDLILDKYYTKDLNNKIINKRKAKESIREFLKLLHRDYYYKSNTLYGDTGQIIILGGLDYNNKYFYNDLSYMFIEVVQELKEPDPKILLRVSKDMPRELMENALKCIATGIGCPLFANDDVIIPKLINFGFEEKDSYNYGTAACWEPYIVGKSFDQNNMGSISFVEPLNTMMENEKLEEIKDFKELKGIFYKYLYLYLEKFKTFQDRKVFSKDALLSLLNDNCVEKGIDISDGGAVYNNYGFTGVGLSNLVNSLFSIKKYVYDDKKYKLDEFNVIRENNYLNNEDLVRQIKNLEDKYGVDNDEIIDLSNEIIKNTSKYFEDKHNPLGGKYKFGLSAPSYISSSQDFPATFDGRKKGEPFGVHISTDKSNGYTELISFASKLDYNDNRFNGNVVDFFITPNFIESNFEKFTDFMILSIKKGYFEMQMNVVSSKQLIEAKKNPNLYPNLIVRVWGFSAYFNDLPDNYKDYLIERALKNEGNCN